MDISQLVHSDEALNVIDNGAWVGDIPGLDGVRLKVRGTQSEAVQKAISEKQAKLRAANKGEPLTTEQHDKITKSVFAEVVLIDWDGFTNKGEPLPYDQKLAKEWLTKRNGKKFFNVVAYCAQKIDGDAESFVGAVEKN